MAAALDVTDPAGATDPTAPRPWLSRSRRLGLSALFLVYLTYVAAGVADYSSGAAEVAGFGLLGLFAAGYLFAVDRGPALPPGRLLGLLGLLGAIVVLELVFARAVAFNLLLYLTAVVVTRFGRRAWPAVVAFTLAALLVPVAIPAWHDDLGDAIGFVTPVAIPVVALLSLCLRQIIEANAALAAARAEVARLSAETERGRIARDLHDLLGHSLTAITVKAGLAHRLGSSDPSRALEEIAEVEVLARRSLHDVRAAVAGYREVTLAGELATGRELLRAAGIATDLPGAVDVVDPEHDELLGWALREGLTNVVRHARASVCTVRVTRTSIEILDDGMGAGAHDGSAGSGLAGLRERARAAGARVESGPRSPGGWRLRVSAGDRVGDAVAGDRVDDAVAGGRAGPGAAR